MNLGAGVILKEDSRARRCRHNERVISVLIADDQEVVLMDIRMPELDGLAATEQILRQQDPPTIVVLTTFDQNEYIYRALRAGAAGFLRKDAPSSRLIAAVRAAATGDSL